jgi:EpsI family protein
MKAEFEMFRTPVTDRRKFLIALLFGSAAAVAAWRQPRKGLNLLGNQKLEDLLPKTIGQWKYVAASGVVVPPKDQMVETLYSEVLTRIYWDGQNSPIMLLMAQSANQTGFLQVHRPETCYTASGFRISAVSPHPIRLGTKTLPANSLEATANGSTEHIVYWTRVGDRIPANWTEQKVAVAEQNLRGVIPDAILVRVSCATADGEAARATIDKFIRSMLSSVPANRRSVFIV